MFRQRPLRVFSGALVDCSKTVPNCHFIAELNKWVLISVLELLLFLAMESRAATGKLFHANGPATAKPRLCIDDSRQRLTTRQNWSADRKCRRTRRPGTAETSTQSSWKYRGALWCIHFPTSCRILNLIRCTAGSQCRLSLINADTGANFGIRSTRRAAEFKIFWSRSVCTAVMPDRTRAAIVNPCDDKWVNQSSNCIVTEENDVLSVSVAADRSTNELFSRHVHPSSAPHRWQHPGRWRLFQGQSLEYVATVLVCRSLRAVFCCQSRYTVSCWDSVSSGLMTFSLWFRRWCLRAQWERASLHSPCRILWWRLLSEILWRFVKAMLLWAPWKNGLHTDYTAHLNLIHTIGILVDLLQTITGQERLRKMQKQT